MILKLSLGDEVVIPTSLFCPIGIVFEPAVITELFARKALRFFTASRFKSTWLFAYGGAIIRGI